ncbi:uncharacterized protein LOC128557181 isoform X2 [Mercenaria mercenaria]|nr:uncharacterized protein LOC128557181 isoform X2 [Mercenaria mercenaria]
MVIKQSELKKNVDIHEKKETATSSKNIHSEKLLIEDLEKADNNVIIPDRPGGSADEKSMPKLLPNDFAQESFQTFQTEANTTISRNSNITPKAIVLEANGFNDETTNIQDLKGQLPVEDTEEYRSGYTKRELESADKEVSVLSRSSYKHNIQRNQLREASLTPILVTENTSKTSEISKKAVPPTEHSLPDNHKIIKTHFEREDLKYVGTFINVSRTPPPGPNDERSFKGRKKNKVLAKSHCSMTQTEKAKKPKTATKFFKVKGKSNKKGQQALISLIRSKSVGVHKNKKGTFYNEDIPTVSETESYLHISELNNTNTGICYDEDNEKARALGHWNNDSHSLVTNVTNLSGNHDRCKSNEMKLALGTAHDRSISRLTSSTDLSLRGSVSVRSINAITSRIDSRGAKYFIENESSSIAIHVKTSDFPDDQGATDLVGSNVNNVENNDNQANEEYEEEDEDDDEDDNEDEDEDDDEEEGEEEDEDDEENIDDCDEAKETSKDTIETSMSVLYGTPNGEEEDPDRMILKGYEHDLVTIKE